MAATFRNLAVVIGINAYQRENGIKPLGTAVNDARAIAQLLKDEYKYSRIYELYDEQATYEAIKTLLNETLPKEIRKSDHLLFYFAGHGITRKGKDGSPAGYLIPQNAKVNLQNAENEQSENFLPMQELYDAFKTINSHHLLVILDCCYAGMFRWATRKLGVAYERIYQEHFARFIENPAWQVIASAAYNQEALDLVTDQRGAIPGTNHSPFALALLQGLGHTDEKPNADWTGDGVITTPELYLYVDKEVNRSTDERQTPGFWSLRDEYDRGEFIFTKPGFDPEKNLTIAPQLNASNNPYRGIKPFEERHSRFFFGRTALVEELSARLSKPGRSLTIVLGVSGSGKSSLVKAGLIPYLRNKQEKDSQAQKWYILDPTRPGESPFTALARVILPLEDAKLLSQLNQIKGLDEVFKAETEPKPKSERSQQEQQSENNSEETNADSTKLADCWINFTPEGKLLLVVDYFKQLQELCPSKELTNLKNTIQEKVDLLAGSLRKEPRYLTQVIARWSRANPNIKLLLIIDQFEELITMAQEHQGKSDSDQKEWQQFLSLLRRTLASHRHRLHIVLTLRADFEPRFLDSSLKAHWRKGRFPVRAMNSDELREAIEQPARKQALYFEPPDLVGRLIDEVGQMPGALPLLSFTLSELYIKLTKRWIDPNSSDRALRIEDYNQLGGVAGALTRRATEEYDNLIRKFGEESGRAYQATMRRVMLRMVAIEGGGVVRRRVPESELEYPDPEENKRVTQVSDQLIKARLLVKGQEKGEPYVEPAHDFLVRGWQKLQEWRTQEQTNLLMQRDVTSDANKWSDNDKQAVGILWDNDPRLSLVKTIFKFDKNWFNLKESKFIQRSIQRRRNNQRRTAGIVAVVITSLSGLAIFAFNQAIESQQQSIVALSKASEAFWTSNQQLEALISAVQAGKVLKKLRITNSPNPTVIALQQAVYGIQENNRLSSHNSPITTINFSPDGQMIASASYDGTIILWNRDGQKIKTLGESRDGPKLVTLPHNNLYVTSVTFNSNSQPVTFSSYNGTITLWNRKGEKLKTFIGLDTNVTQVTSSPDGQKFASVSIDGTIRLWSLEGKKLKTIIGHGSNLTSVSFSPDSQTIAFNSSNGTVILWNLEGEKLKTLTGNGSDVTSISFSPDSQTIASGNSDGTITLWSQKGEKLKTLTGNGSDATSISFSPDSQTIACISKDGTITLWSQKGEKLKTLVGSRTFTRLSFSPDSQTIASGSHDGTITLWSRETHRLKELTRNDNSLARASFDLDSQRIASSSSNKTVILWNRDGQKLKVLTGHTDTVERVSFSPDGQMLASVSNGTVIIWSRNGQKLQTLARNTNSFSVSLSPDNQTIASAGSDGTVTIWSRDGQKLKTLSGHSSGVRSVSFSPDGQTIASGSFDGTVILWSKEGEKIKTLTGHGSGVNSISFSPDGQTIASGSLDGTVILWNHSGERFKTLTGHKSSVYSVSFSPDSQTIASGSGDGTVILWSRDGEKLTTLDAAAGSVSFSPDGQTIASAGYGVSFSPDGQTIASAGSNETVILWNFDLDDLLERSCDWLREYLRTNPNNEDKRQLCDGIGTQGS